MKADAILKTVNFNLYDMLMTANDETFENPINSFTGIVATQVVYKLFVHLMFGITYT